METKGDRTEHAETDKLLAASHSRTSFGRQNEKERELVTSFPLHHRQQNWRPKHAQDHGAIIWRRITDDFSIPSESTIA